MKNKPIQNNLYSIATLVSEEMRSRDNQAVLSATPFKINHVMSRNELSGIFLSIINYFKKYSTRGVENIVSVKPIVGANVYHYHRPNLEKKLKHPSIITVHHDLDDTDRWFRFNKFAGQYQSCTHIVCLNSKQKKRLIEFGISADKISIIPHGYNDQLLSLKVFNERDWSHHKLNIGIISKLYGRRVKGEAYLYELAKRLNPEKVRFTLVGEDRTITAFELRRLGHECVAFDRLPYRIIQSVYDEIDVLMMCSLYEGGPANIQEALATGTPVISSAVGQSLDYIRENQNGIFLTMDPNLDEIRISALIQNDYKSYRKLAKKTQKSPIPPLTWKEVVAKYLSVYEEMSESSMPFSVHERIR